MYYQICGYYVIIKKRKDMFMCNNISQIRRRARITQRQLAEALNVSQQYISDIENGKTVPSLKFAFDMKIFFNTTIEEMFYICD